MSHLARTLHQAASSRQSPRDTLLVHGHNLTSSARTSIAGNRPDPIDCRMNRKKACNIIDCACCRCGIPYIDFSMHSSFRRVGSGRCFRSTHVFDAPMRVLRVICYVDSMAVLPSRSVLQTELTAPSHVSLTVLLWGPCAAVSRQN